ncbi:MAG TPA: hypothetical protein VJG32_17785 [Anaerolineae bacterium]|nr:hypothetical protein [Anaerolineae bacterium]
MSATGRTNGKRNKSDFYETPRALAGAVLDYIRAHYGISSPALVLDPGAGTGVWGKAARERWPKALIMGVDLYRARPDTIYDDWFRCSYTTFERRYFRDDRPDLIIGNPPYSLAQSFIEASLRLLAPGGLLSFLLRINLLAGQCREDFWKQRPLSRLVTCIERPSFNGGGSDATEYALFVWSDRLLDGPKIEWLSWR